MKDIRLFERELNLIKDKELRMHVQTFLEDGTCDYFWTDGASSSGKFHPAFAQGVGGLVRHTKAVVMFAEELLRMSSYAYMKDEYKDFVIAACILHDTCKYGMYKYDKNEYKNHATAAANRFDEWCYEEDYRPHFLLLQAIRSHMGQWSTEKEDRPFTAVDRCVHMADYMASRSFIDIPAITEEYMAVACQWAEENHELPL
ncbi:MAG: HD domain-containing protein [Clostridia bacterium]|nr:HD domain-containing protein [Clostridia bacterium]